MKKHGSVFSLPSPNINQLFNIRELCFLEISSYVTYMEGSVLHKINLSSVTFIDLRERKREGKYECLTQRAN